ncbi:hypercellular protein [Salix suchowensis]|nr:hypercellular protein [Salix suchowensis]
MAPPPRRSREDICPRNNGRDLLLLGLQTERSIRSTRGPWVLLDLIVCGREEDGAFRSALPSIHSKDDGIGNVSMRISESVAGNAGILILLKYVCSVLGIHLDAVRLSGSEDGEAQVEGEGYKATSSQAYDEDIAEDLQEPFGLPELQVGVMREAIAVAEALPVEKPISALSTRAQSANAIITGSKDPFLYNPRRGVEQAPGGAPREFILPLSTETEEVRLSQKRSVIVCETERAKYSGLDARPWEKLRRRHQSKPQISETVFKFLECKVVQEQPLLRIRRASVTHGAVTLYEGEKSSLRMTLENVSSLSVDFLRLAFEDSTMAAAQQALTEGGMSIFETYETEYELLHNPLFTWSSKSIINIPPNKKHVLAVDCFGKGGWYVYSSQQHRFG